MKNSRLNLMSITRRIHLTAALASAFCFPTSAFSEDWPEFRGPTKQGHSSASGLPVEWSPTKNIVWKAELPGRAWSSPIVIGERIFLTNAVGAKDSTDPHDTFSLRVLALNAADGKVIWDTEVFRVARWLRRERTDSRDEKGRGDASQTPESGEHLPCAHGKPRAAGASWR
jgi:hypothetical protein